MDLRLLTSRVTCLLASLSGAAAAETPPAAPVIAESGGRLARAIDSLLPTSLQRWPTVHFNAITEMTAEGKKWRVPTPEQPIYYHAPEPKFTQTGWAVAAGEKPPPVAELDATIRKALAANGYLPVPDGVRPDILVVLTFGSHGTDPASTAPLESMEVAPTTASELIPLVLADPSLWRDVIDRAAFIGGEKFARELRVALEGEVRNRTVNRSFARVPGVAEPPMPVAPAFGSPFQVFLESQKDRAVIEQLAELAFRTCYFVLATAYDFKGVEKRQRIPLWQTRLTVDAQGVSMREIMGPLVATAGPYLGRDQPEPIVVKRQLNRTGRVDIGTPTVVEEPKPAPAPASPQKP